MNNSSHLVLQGKGGVGKSFSASALAQYLIERGYKIICADTDPVNSSFHQFKALEVDLVKIMEGGVISQKLFDPLFEEMLSADEVCVVDNGASTFIPMLKFISDNEMLSALQDAGKQLYIHTVVTAGQAKDDTFNGLQKLIEIIRSAESNTKVVVWQNEFWGVPKFEGKSLFETDLIVRNGDIVQGVCTVIDRNSDAFSMDIRNVLESHLTLKEVRHSEAFGVISKSRIYRVYNDIFTELDKVFQVEVGK
ncbi:conjugal transfer protein, TraL family [Pseudomonas protegens]|uniref:Conjugal transfer protein, TraL family n=1 Tax=Pseudomonas protegens TaxID=380021 RepID=A0A2T6GBE2_9PSED|nr:ArsA-related P-loop ATPase [Pseudomonas protegens]PUA41476.1 conjugal transfer protein, TraL family [Pseudomonas protegens]